MSPTRNIASWRTPSCGGTVSPVVACSNQLLNRFGFCMGRAPVGTSPRSRSLRQSTPRAQHHLQNFQIRKQLSTDSPYRNYGAIFRHHHRQIAYSPKIVPLFLRSLSSQQHDLIDHLAAVGTGHPLGSSSPLQVTIGNRLTLYKLQCLPNRNPGRTVLKGMPGAHLHPLPDPVLASRDIAPPSTQQLDARRRLSFPSTTPVMMLG